MMSSSQSQQQQQYVDHAALMTSLAQSGGGVRTEQHGNQIVHVRGDSDSDLEALFSVLHNLDTSRPPSSSYKNRKLPASFFRPPDPKSTASAHGRSVSSPAQLHHHPMSSGAALGSMASAGGGQSQQQLGFKATSSAADSSSTFAAGDEFQNGCPQSSMQQCRNWETASKNCPRYFLK